MRNIVFAFVIVLITSGLAFIFLKTQKPAAKDIEILLEKLEIPWEITFLPNRDLLVTERPGKLTIFGKGTKTYKIKEVFHIGEGGLLGLALHPDFEKNHFLYLYYTYKDNGKIFNKVGRFLLEGGSLKEDRTVISGIPAFEYHDGGRIKFGPEGKFYITTGDAGNKKSAQDLGSLSGKILRLSDDGSIPSDNPFPESPVYSYGHRNAQGLAWDENGQLWATEHGQDARDEINKIDPGKNYGWPIIEGERKGERMETPFIQSGVETWAPSGATVKDNKLYFAGLAGRAIFVLDLKTKEIRKFAEGKFGRIRTINLGFDGNFYILTSNRDGRNENPDPSDDRIIMLPPSYFGFND